MNSDIRTSGHLIDNQQNVRQLTDFYLTEDQSGRNLFQVWEAGDARGDSITPSTHSTDYRAWMADKLIALLGEPPAGLVSIGCGNAAVEHRVHRCGYRVLAVDVIDEAVRIAAEKGMQTALADVRTWSPDEPWPVVYADGLLGHLYDPAVGITAQLKHFRSWLPKNGYLVISNDSPPDDDAPLPARGVPGFHWLPTAYLRESALAAGFADVMTEDYTYDRPKSGPRRRAILVAREPGR